MKSLLTIATLVITLTTNLCNALAADNCSRSSPAHTIALLELFSSEGCNSCPPADKALTALRQSPDANNQKAIGLAWHVDYWDSLGWKDPFASAANTARQRALSAANHSKTIYTPEYFINGHELRTWSNTMHDAIAATNARPATANIQLQHPHLVGNTIIVDVNAQTMQSAELRLVAIQQNIVSRVNAGENNGTTLHHNGVVRTEAMPINLSPNKNIQQQMQLAMPSNAMLRDIQIVAFIQNFQGKISQAVSAPLCAQ